MRIMGLENLIKREISITILTVLLVTTLFIMFSYAIFKVDTEGEVNAITFGDVNMQFCSDVNCTSTLTNVDNVIGKTNENGETKYVPVYPQDDPQNKEDWEKLKPYTFTLKNTGSLDLYVKIKLEKDNTANTITQYNDMAHLSEDFSTQVEDTEIKVAISENGTDPKPKLYSETSKDNEGHIIAEGIYLPAGETKTFNLYIYLTSTAQNEDQGKYFVTQISAQGEFIPEGIEPPKNSLNGQAEPGN